MLIAEEVGTKSKWAIPPELYFQMAPTAQVYTFSEHILHFFLENISLKKFPFSSDLHDYLKTIYGSLSRFLRFKDITLQKPRLVPVNYMKI